MKLAEFFFRSDIDFSSIGVGRKIFNANHQLAVIAWFVQICPIFPLTPRSNKAVPGEVFPSVAYGSKDARSLF